jgi:SPW repeat-containing protein
MKWASWTNAILGVWLILAPWVLRYPSNVPSGEDVLLGISVLLIAAWSANADQAVTGPAWTTMILGIWITISPWALGYRGLTQALANDVFVGILIVTFSITLVAGRMVTVGPPPPSRPL